MHQLCILFRDGFMPSPWIYALINALSISVEMGLCPLWIYTWHKFFMPQFMPSLIYVLPISSFISNVSHIFKIIDVKFVPNIRQGHSGHLSYGLVCDALRRLQTWNLFLFKVSRCSQMPTDARQLYNYLSYKCSRGAEKTSLRNCVHWNKLRVVRDTIPCVLWQLDDVSIAIFGHSITKCSDRPITPLSSKFLRVRMNDVKLMNHVCP